MQWKGMCSFKVVWYILFIAQDYKQQIFLGTYVFFYVKKEVSKDMYYLPPKNKVSSVELALTSTADYGKACV